MKVNVDDKKAFNTFEKYLWITPLQFAFPLLHSC
jgi:hypothetical protein